MKAYCENCDVIGPASFRPGNDTKTGMPYEDICCEQCQFLIATVTERGTAEFDRDTDGEMLIDWSPAKGRMVTLSLGAGGRLAYAITWDGEQEHGTAQMPGSAGNAGVAPARQTEQEGGA